MSTVFKNICHYFSKPIYIQIWQSRLKVSVVGEGDVYDEKPLMAILTTDKGVKVIKAIGNSAEGLEANNIVVVNPFCHPRLLLSDFLVAEKMLQYVIFKLHKNAKFRPCPSAIVHPMEKIDGGLTQIEIRALKELMLGSGVFESYLHTGYPLSVNGICFDDLVKNLKPLK